MSKNPVILSVFFNDEIVFDTIVSLDDDFRPAHGDVLLINADNNSNDDVETTVDFTYWYLDADTGRTYRTIFVDLTLDSDEDEGLCDGCIVEKLVAKLKAMKFAL